MTSDLRQHLGRLGEDLALEHLERLGYRLVARNHRTRFGELDLIVCDDLTIVFVEVKARRVGAVAGALESVPARPALAIGHSLGGWVLAMVVDRLQPGLAVYEDPAWDVTADEQVEIAGFLRSLPTPPEFDRAVLAGLLPGRSYDDSPPAATVPSLLMLADPSDRVSPDEAAGFRRRGFTVSTVPGAGHDIHTEDLAGFLACFDRWAKAVADPQETGR